MRKNGLESIFKDRFDNHKESIDANDMITRLNLEEPKKKKRSFIFWIFGSLVGLALVGGGLFIIDYNKKTSIVPSTYKQDRSSNIAIVESADLLEQKNEQAIKSNENINDNPKQDIDSKSYATNSKANHLETERTSLNNSKTSENHPLKNQYDTFNFTSSNNGLQEVNKINDRTNLDDKAKYSLSQTSLVSKDLSHLSNDIIHTTILVLPVIKALTFPLLDSRQGRMKIGLSITNNLFQNNEAKKKIKQSTYVEAYGSVNLVTRTLTTSSGIYNDHVELRNQQENQLEAIQVGLAVTKSLCKRFYISSGLEYTQINEKTDINYSTDTILVADEYPVLLQIKSTGDTITTIGTSNIDATINHTLVEYNHHRLFALPINFGINGKINKLTWFVDAGLSLNLYGGFYGKTIDIDNQVVTSPSYFKPKLGFGYRANLGLAYPISERIDMSLSTKFQHNTSSITDEKYVSQTYKFLGMKLGIRYQLNY